MSEQSYSIQYPGDADADDLVWGEIEAKGLLPISIIAGERVSSAVFYDPVRLQQDVASEGDRFALPGLVVVPRITRESVEHAIEELSRTGFAELQGW
jgi:hypothetical protein